jgi:hypothetical protein
MGNICDAMGITTKQKLENKAIDPRNSNSERHTDEDLEPTASTTSPVPAAAAAALQYSADAVRAAELRVAFAKKAKEESDAAKAALALTQSSGPRIRLLPHQHTLFCERKVCICLRLFLLKGSYNAFCCHVLQQRVCTASGQLQEMEVLAVSCFSV